MTPDDYYRMLEEQGGRCAICKVEECKTGTRFSVDHDHGCCAKPKTCGSCNRGLLCRTCNVGIGNLQDSIEILKNAIKYLLKFVSPEEPDFFVRMTKGKYEEYGAPRDPWGNEMEQEQ